MVSVAEARVATAASAHQDSTGSWAARSWSMMPRNCARFLLDAREALDNRHVAERVGRVVGEARVKQLDRSLHRLRLAQHHRSEDGEDEEQHHQQQA